MSSTELYISAVRTPSTGFFICEVYGKHRRVVFQINRDGLICYFVYLHVYVSPQICPANFKAVSFSLMLNPLDVTVSKRFTPLFLCVYIYMGGSISSLIYTWLNNRDILCLHIFVFILSSHCIDFIISSIYQFWSILGDCIPENKNIYVGLTSTTL